jgi:hypothetical protein
VRDWNPGPLDPETFVLTTKLVTKPPSPSRFVFSLQEASVYLFEKKSVERYSRGDRDAIVDLLRSGVQQLTKLRHPKILAIIQPLEESRCIFLKPLLLM